MLGNSQILEIIHREVQPALGCTEPIAVALAVAKAVEIIKDNCPGCLTDAEDSTDLAFIIFLDLYLDLLHLVSIILNILTPAVD